MSLKADFKKWMFRFSEKDKVNNSASVVLADKL